MPIHDFRCDSCGHVRAELVKWDVKNLPCPKCDNDSKRVFLKLAKPNYLAMGAQENVSPEFKERFDKMHRKETKRQQSFEKEHGEGEYYNTAPGG